MTPWRLVFGLILISVGALFLLETAGFEVNAYGLIANWWPLAIIAFGAAQLVASSEARVGPSIVVLIGLALLGVTLGLVKTSVLAVIGPLLLIGIGGWLLIGRAGGLKRGGDEVDSVDSLAVFGDVDTQIHSQGFRGGFLGSLLGDNKLDLRGARLAPEGASISILNVLGDVVLTVPEGWRVQVSGLPVFSDVDNITLGEPHPSADNAVLRLDVLALFADVKIRH